MSNLQNLINNYIVHEEDLYEEDGPRSYPVSEKDYEEKIQEEEDEIEEVERVQLETRNRIPQIVQPLNIATTKPVSVQEIKTIPRGNNCPEHPDEVIQYYSFTNEKALCSECLLSGQFNGCDVQSLKKAGDKIKVKLEELLQEVSEKTPAFEQIEAKLCTKKDELESFTVHYKNEVSQKLNQLRAIIDEKERSLLESIERIKDEKQVEVDSHQLKIRNCFEDFTSVQGALQNKIAELKDLELCQYYLAKAKPIRGLISESSFKITEAKLVAQSGDAKDQFNLDEFQTGFQKAIKEILALKGLEPKVSRGYRFSLGGLQSRNSQEIVIPEQISEFEKTTQIVRNPSLMQDRLAETPISINQSPFKALRKDLELISPMSIAKLEESTPMSPSDDALRKLLARVEELRKSNQQGLNETAEIKRDEINIHANVPVRRTPIQNDLTSSRKELRVASVSKLGQERDSVKKFWDTYKDLLEDQNRKKGYMTSSIKKLGDLEKNKPNLSKTFIPEFSSPKGSIMSDYASPKKRDIFEGLNNINTLVSAKNLRSLVSDDHHNNAKSSHKNLKYYFKSSSISKSRHEDNFNLGNSTNKSFTPNSLTYNLKKLRKEMGYGQPDN